MGEGSRSMNLEELMVYEKKMVDFLKDETDIVSFKHFLRQSDALLTQCEKDFKQTQNSIEGYKNKIDSCKHKATALEHERDSDKELAVLERDLEENQQLELTLRKELREIIDEIEDLERQRVSVEEQRLTMRKMERDALKLESKLSMYASVTRIIPNMEEPSVISGHIVDREKKDVKNFELDSQMSSFDSCDHIWKLINSS